MSSERGLADILLGLFVVVVSLSIHEFGHAYVAWRCGDDTAARQGRLTLNPLAHLDPVGTVFLVMMTLTSIPMIGWAKPVPVNPYNLRHLERDHMFVAAAGPVANLILATLAAILFRGAHHFYGGAHAGGPIGSLLEILLNFVVINIGLALFNLIPLGPLDGASVLRFFLPRSMRDTLEKVNQYGMFILFALIFTGATRFIGIPVWYLTKILID